jgi:hypothetical protein
MTAETTIGTIRTIGSWSRRGRLVTLLAAWLLARAGAARAGGRDSTILVLPGTGAGVSAKLIQTARTLFVERLSERERSFVLLDMDRAPVTTPLDPAHAVRMGLDRDARAVFLFDLRRSEATTVISVSGFAVPDGEKLFAFEERTSKGPEVLPAMVDRAVDNAILYRARPAVREPRTVFLGVRANGAVPLNTAGRTNTFLGGAGAYLLKDSTRGFYDLGIDFLSQDDNHWAVKFGLGGFATFWAEDDTPYLGLSACWKWARLGGQGASGFVLAPAIGVVWRRHTMASFRLEASFYVDTFTEKGLDRLRPGSSDPHLGYGPLLSVGAWL